MERNKRIQLILVPFIVATFGLAARARSIVPAIYVFGDSTFDVGNNNFLTSDKFKVNYTPYGIDFPGEKPTGRFSNGIIGADMIARRLGFRNSPPAYLSIASNKHASRGVNFASGGSGIFDATNADSSISQNQQVRNLKNISSRLENRDGRVAAGIYLSRSIFVFSTGNNDLVGYYLTFGVQNQTQQAQFIALLSDRFKNQLKTAYDLGAKKFLVFGTSLIGCAPIFRLSVPSGGCVEYLNGLSQQFNNATKKALQELAANLTGFRYSFINVYDFTTLLIADPLKFGFTNIVSPCCGTASGCLSNSTYCSDRDAYYFWDRVHASQAAFKTVISAAFRGRVYASPESILHLAKEKKIRK